MSDLVDTTEMYLRTIFELEEEGVVPLRARISERLGQSGPTVSETVARMQRDGLVTVEGDRHLQLSAEGRRLAESVMRKHRLAECVLVDVIGLPLELVHDEACRWEHVMSDELEQRLLEYLGNATHSPFGNPVPGVAAQPAGGRPLREIGEQVRDREVSNVTLVRIAEPLQFDGNLLRQFTEHGLAVGRRTAVSALPNGGFQLGEVALTAEQAGRVYVEV